MANGMSKAHARQSSANKTRRAAYRAAERKSVNAIIKLMQTLRRNPCDNDALYALRKFTVTAKAKARDEFRKIYGNDVFKISLAWGATLKEGSWGTDCNAFFDKAFEASNQAKKPGDLPKIKPEKVSQNYFDNRKERDQDRAVDALADDLRTWNDGFSFRQKAIVARNMSRLVAVHTQTIKLKDGRQMNVMVHNPDAFEPSRVYSYILNGIMSPTDFGMKWEVIMALVGKPENWTVTKQAA